MLRFNNIFSFSVIILFIFSFAFSNVQANLNSDNKLNKIYLKEGFDKILINDYLPNISLNNSEHEFYNEAVIKLLELKLTKQRLSKAKKLVIVKHNRVKTKKPHKTQKNNLKHTQTSKLKIVKPKQWLPKSARLKTTYRKILAQKIIPRKAVEMSFKFYEKYRRNHNLSSKYITVADYTKSSSRNRLHIISIATGKISSYFVSHAKKSGPLGGKVLRTSNRVGSNKTSKGFFKVGFRVGITATKRYKYLTVNGLERSNRKVGWPTRLGGRDVIIHTAKYANNGGRLLCHSS